MTKQTEELRSKRCKACEGLENLLAEGDARRQLEAVPQWELGNQARQITRDWECKDFQAAIDFFNRVAQLAEEEGHHPDLHLTNYRHASIVLSTHSIGGLSENDFILASKIDALPVELRR